MTTYRAKQPFTVQAWRWGDLTPEKQMEFAGHPRWLKNVAMTDDLWVVDVDPPLLMLDVFTDTEFRELFEEVPE